jgi:predicted transcriptional regulator
MDKLELPDAGDIAICINCGAILVYSDPQRNVTRYARRIEIETLPREAKQKLSVAQQFIRKRGWIPRDADRRDGN